MSPRVMSPRARGRSKTLKTPLPDHVADGVNATFNPVGSTRQTKEALCPIVHFTLKNTAH